MIIIISISTSNDSIDTISAIGTDIKQMPKSKELLNSDGNMDMENSAMQPSRTKMSLFLSLASKRIQL